MLHTLPLPLPASLVEHHRIDLSALYSTGWGVEAYDVVVAPSGDTYALYGVYRHTWNVSRDEEDPAVANFGYRLITRYSPEGVPLATALCCSSLPDGTPSAVANGNDMTLCVLPDGTLSVNAHPDCTTLMAPDLSAVTATYATPGRNYSDKLVPGDHFASSINVTPSGHLLCVTTEYGVHRYGNSIANIVGLADGGALGAHSKPTVRAIASLDPRPAHQTEADLRPQVLFQGEPVGLENRPRPSLTELLAPETNRFAWDQSRLGRPAPLSDDLFVVPVFARTFRGGSRGQPFVFALLNDQGEMTGRLHGMDLWRDSPFTGFCFTVVADPGRGHAFHLNRYGLYAWNRSGQLRAKLDAGTKTFKPLTRFTLMSCSPAGELLLVHKKQHLILRVPIPDDLGDLGQAVEAALRGYAKERTALKKQWAPVDWHWIQEAAQVHRL
ncbi:hypothetical protein [Streptomyces cinnamoneus]|uniref:Uncharacterized protein n=1 Tax=Streptomyces cinnamoneus TaxID=53446 RepID=A0A918WD81_STRCJ|nr:hypothetical protein [Streptomyces cinnamoneus]GHC40171.1 hypothetical protein GCM10010507_12810 [Streptomyces cinnamoneus]